MPTDEPGPTGGTVQPPCVKLGTRGGTGQKPCFMNPSTLVMGTKWRQELSYSDTRRHRITPGWQNQGKNSAFYRGGGIVRSL